MSGSTGVSKQATLRCFFLSFPFLHSCSVDTLQFMARPCRAAILPKKAPLELRETLRSLLPLHCMWGAGDHLHLMETRDENPWYHCCCHLQTLSALWAFPPQLASASPVQQTPDGATALPLPHDDGVKVRRNNLLLSGLLLVTMSCFLAGKFPVWLCCFLLHFGILLPYYCLPVKADASLLPRPSDCELVGLVARNLISFWNAFKSLVLVGIFPDLAGLEFCNVQLELEMNYRCSSKNRQVWGRPKVFSSLVWAFLY